jgi:hypothetical protein
MMEVVGDVQREIVVLAGDDKAIDFTVDLRSVEVAPPYGAPPARRRVV